MKIREILTTAAVVEGLPPRAVFGRSGKRPLARMRQRAYWAARRLRPDASFPLIGRVADRHHTAILIASRQVEKRIAADPAEALACQRLLDALSPEGRHV